MSLGAQYGIISPSETHIKEEREGEEGDMETGRDRTDRGKTETEKHMI